jgi:hypothetical protein
MADTGKKLMAAHVSKMLTGTKKHFPNGSQSLPLVGGAHTVDEIANDMQSLVTNRSNVEAAQTAATVAVEAETAAWPSLLAIVVAYTKYLRATLGTSDLADFDVTPFKARAPMTAVQKAAAAAKAAATRKARGTTSAKQKKAVKGNVTAQLVVTPAPAPAAPAPAAAPGATGGTTGGGTAPSHG